MANNRRGEAVAGAAAICGMIAGGVGLGGAGSSFGLVANASLRN